jgi:NADH-quinone oxidoreductase subunit F
MQEIRSIADLERIKEEVLAARKSRDAGILLCCGPGCQAYGCRRLTDSFRDEIARRGLESRVELRTTGCRGFCERGALLVIEPQDIFYQQVKPEDIPEIIEKTILGGELVERLLYQDPRTGKKVVHEDEVPFYNRQTRVVFRDTRNIDPEKIEDYIALGGYRALHKALFEMQPEEVIETIKASGLRGRGGGGFDTGWKWESCRKAAGDVKYVICNADEGDPGAYMDRGLLEGSPHSVLEGMIIGAYAIGSREGYIYVRNEYPLAVVHSRKAIRQAEEHGLLGENILGSGFSFDVRINRGGGAFVCGESTALMASLEGKTGEPRAKYIHTVESGLWSRPSNLNNVETWANVPLIINRGASWFASIGTAKSKGTKMFSLVGKVNNTGLVEVPMGMTLREMIFDIGGGIRGGKKFKGVQTGGPSGGCVPESLLDLPVDFERLTEAGSMMGSGGMIVMDEETCMVDVARYFIRFLRQESCGKCVPCREGIRHMDGILTRITEGGGREEDPGLLETIAHWVADASLCGLGTSAPNPVLSTLRYYREEYETHIREKRCPAGVCKALIRFGIAADRCTGCMACIKACPTEAIHGRKKEVHTLDQTRCIRCGACLESCRFGAVERN